MESTGKIVGISKDIMSGKLILSFQINTEPIDELNEFGRTSDVLDIIVKKHRKKRSLDANAYFHALVGKIADVLTISKTRCKNILIGRYGQQDFIEEGSPVILKTNISVDKMLEQEFLHTSPCGTKEENGTLVVFYKVFRPSHTYNSKEFSILLNGTIEEAKALGIETIPPAELQRMMAAWKPKEV